MVDALRGFGPVVQQLGDHVLLILLIDVVVDLANSAGALGRDVQGFQRLDLLDEPFESLLLEIFDGAKTNIVADQLLLPLRLLEL